MIQDCKIQKYAKVRMPTGVLDSKNKKFKNEIFSEKFGGYFMLCGDLSLLFYNEDDKISP